MKKIFYMVRKNFIIQKTKMIIKKLQIHEYVISRLKNFIKNPQQRPVQSSTLPVTEMQPSTV